MERPPAHTIPANIRLLCLVALLTPTVLIAWFLIDCNREMRVRIVVNPDGVTMALDQEGLQMLYGSHARVPDLEDGLQILDGSPKAMAKLNSSHVVVLPKATRLESLDENVMYLERSTVDT